MALRGKDPDSIQKRLKALFYGNSGVGKTYAAIQFPTPYLIDTEKGCEHEQYRRELKKSGGVSFQTSDFDDLIKEVKTLLTESHKYKTLIIDPLTTIYNDLLDKASLKTGTEFGKHYTEANKHIKRLLNLLYRLDMNVIITSHSKNEYGNGMTVIGQTFDCYKKLDYLFDLVFEVQKKGKDKRIGLVKKSRLEAFEDESTFPFSYDEISKRYGREILEKESESQKLATKDQVIELKRLIEIMKISEEITQKWLDKVNADLFDEMPFDSIQKCIDHLKSKIDGKIES